MRFLVICLSLPFYLEAQLLRQVDGVVVFHDHHILSGPLEVCPELNFIARLSENGREVIPIHSVLRLHFFDTEENLNRRYCVLSGDNRMPDMFEIVVDGPVQILRKKHPKTDGMDSRYHYSYFLRYQSRQYALHKFRTAIYPSLLDEYGSVLKDYLRKHRLSPNNPADVIQIVKYLNVMATMPSKMSGVNTVASGENTSDFL